MIYGSQNVSTHNSTCNPHSHLGGGRLNTLTLENRLTPSLVSLSVSFPAYHLSVTQCNQQTRVKSFGTVFTCFELQNLRMTLLFCTSNSNHTELRAVPQTRQAVPHLCALPWCGCHLPKLAPKSWCSWVNSQTFTNPLHRARPSHFMSGDPRLTFPDSEETPLPLRNVSCASCPREEPTPPLFPGQKSGVAPVLSDMVVNIAFHPKDHSTQSRRPIPLDADWSEVATGLLNPISDLLMLFSLHLNSLRDGAIVLTHNQLLCKPRDWREFSQNILPVGWRNWRSLLTPSWESSLRPAEVDSWSRVPEGEG